VTDEINSSQLLKMMRYDVASSTGFMPFNKLNTSKDPDENGQYALSGNRNFYFGMKVDVPFVMTKGGKITTYDGKESDMIFKFSGDDDMWVFIDGRLVLDLGGVHDKVTGEINFATGVVRTVGNHYDANTGKYKTDVTTETVNNTYVESMSVGRHSLQVFFLERGGQVSNCKITFRLQEDQTPDETEKPEDIVGPTEEPTPEPTEAPTEEPTQEPTEAPTQEPTEAPTQEPTIEPEEPTVEPEEPTVEPEEPTVVPGEPTEIPTEEPTTEPTVEPTKEVTPVPTKEPVPEHTEKPTVAPTEAPIDTPTKEPGDIVTPTNPTDDEGNVDVDDDEIESTPKEEDEEVKPVPDEDTSLDNSDDDDDEVIDGGGKNNGVLDKVKDVIDNTIPAGVLPKTGTISGTIFYVVGALLIIVGAVVLVIYVRKKKR
jgi:fibro-slime domain-containing protein/LPXTG-motif cell wall-anchored protein